MHPKDVRLNGEMTQAAFYCVERELRGRRLHHAPIPHTLQQLRNMLDIAIRCETDAGTTPNGDSEESKLIDTGTAAAILGLSKRRVRKIATDLDGENIGNRWVFRLPVVVEYAQAKEERRCPTYRPLNGYSTPSPNSSDPSTTQTSGPSSPPPARRPDPNTRRQLELWSTTAE